MFEKYKSLHPYVLWGYCLSILSIVISCTAVVVALL